MPLIAHKDENWVRAGWGELGEGRVGRTGWGPGGESWVRAQGNRERVYVPLNVPLQRWALSRFLKLNGVRSPIVLGLVVGTARRLASGCTLDTPRTKAMDPVKDLHCSGFTVYISFVWLEKHLNLSIRQRCFIRVAQLSLSFTARCEGVICRASGWTLPLVMSQVDASHLVVK